MSDLENYISAGDAAKQLKCTRQAIRAAIARGRLKAVKLGFFWLINKEDLNNYSPKKRKNKKQS